MVHTCPICGTTCHCNGDIDDCCFDFDEDVDNCTQAIMYTSFLTSICNICQFAKKKGFPVFLIKFVFKFFLSYP